MSLKTHGDIAQIRAAGRLIEQIFVKLDSQIVPGVRPAELESFAARALGHHNMRLPDGAFADFPAALSCNINQIAAHGVPGDEPLREGDVVTLDIAGSLDGWYADGAWTWCAGAKQPATRRLVRAAWYACWEGIRACRAGAYLGDVASAVSAGAGRFGCRVVREFAGHGIGLALHEEPTVFFGEDVGRGPQIRPGMTLTIEPVVTLGSGKVAPISDGWGFATTDGRPTAQYEHTVAVFREHTEVLTYSRALERVDYPPFF
jgi:methionyl aminopeptidase